MRFRGFWEVWARLFRPLITRVQHTLGGLLATIADASESLCIKHLIMGAASLIPCVSSGILGGRRNGIPQPTDTPKSGQGENLPQEKHTLTLDPHSLPPVLRLVLGNGRQQTFRGGFIRSIYMGLDDQVQIAHFFIVMFADSMTFETRTLCPFYFR